MPTSAFNQCFWSDSDSEIRDQLQIWKSGIESGFRNLGLNPDSEIRDQTWIGKSIEVRLLVEKGPIHTS
jgi:hypothetical protein